MPSSLLCSRLLSVTVRDIDLSGKDRMPWSYQRRAHGAAQQRYSRRRRCSPCIRFGLGGSQWLAHTSVWRIHAMQIDCSYHQGFRNARRTIAYLEGIELRPSVLPPRILSELAELRSISKGFVNLLVASRGP
ncbi:hypothetical protein VNO77_03085 [Canavalia gladiata]|uniref:Uncharacterized protein n=1 Tax=Canavalia gladiata TaxID=3824 RepID=A0AAN9R6L9_CANGL